ncbi:nitric oxide-associated protein 1 isoform X2 [Tachypleus tridentatus]|uniref:nitric oxide-associated protein 1 isoform X2 n=1 Tax=Tachypleus tridentatus TaxID=6853 RepID=UPI003FD5E0CC
MIRTIVFFCCDCRSCVKLNNNMFQSSKMNVIVCFQGLKVALNSRKNIQFKKNVLGMAVRTLRATKVWPSSSPNNGNVNVTPIASNNSSSVSGCSGRIDRSVTARKNKKMSKLLSKENKCDGFNERELKLKENVNYVLEEVKNMSREFHLLFENENFDRKDVHKVKRTKGEKIFISSSVLAESPVSLLGDGRRSRIRYQRYKLKMLKKKVQCKESIQDNLEGQIENNLPIMIKLMMKTPDYSKYLSKYSDLVKSQVCATKDRHRHVESEECIIQYPFANRGETSVIDASVVKNKDHFTENNSNSRHQGNPKDLEFKNTHISHLLNNMCQNENSKNPSVIRDTPAIHEEILKSDYGTPDPSFPISNVPCGGCGALMHCKDIGIPGYMPVEKFNKYSEIQLRAELCQRCLYLQHFNVVLNVSVNPDEYPHIMSEIKNKIALVVLIVDLTDFPCSIWPGIIDILGPKRPVFVVGNKVDLLPCDDSGYLDRVKRVLQETLKRTGVDRGKNIKHVCLISARTGYGIEEFITKLQNVWSYKGDVYLVGCTNVGKSTIFNALLQSDYCKTRAVDLVQRATTSVWPGTTLNLLKFPILRPNGWRLYYRTMRLKEDKRKASEEAKLQKSLYQVTRNPKHATLLGHIGMTFRKEHSQQFTKVPSAKTVFNPDDPEFVRGRFCHDTPGAVYKDQILDLLTTEELVKTLPREIIIPRTFQLRPLQTLFVAGLARIDLIKESLFPA